MITEDQLEQQCLGWFREGDWETVFGPDIALFTTHYRLLALPDTLLPQSHEM
jgi:hypothetical protein